MAPTMLPLLPAGGGGKRIRLSKEKNPKESVRPQKFKECYSILPAERWRQTRTKDKLEEKCYRKMGTEMGDGMKLQTCEKSQQD